MVDKKEDDVTEEALSQINQIRKAANEFRKNVAGLVKNMNVESEGWRFNVESAEKGVIVDVAIKLLIKKKTP
jgi:hypothetical protein